MNRQAWNQDNDDSQVTTPEECVLQDHILEQDLHNDEDWDLVRLQPRQTSIQTVVNPHTSWFDPFGRFWKHHVRVSVPHKECRDHLANERTFLGYLRSSVYLSIMGVIIAQLYRIQHAPDPDPTFGYYMLGKPIAAIMQASAGAMIIIGAHRFWRQQSAMTRGKIHAGGWELMVIGGYSMILLVGLFAVHLGVEIYKETK